MTTRYTYGDSSAASQRLARLSEAYDPSSKRLLASLDDDVGVAVDLGCGPGFTTELIADIVRPRSLTAVDASTAFLEEAAARVPAAKTIRADVAITPHPWEEADLTYCRFLLGHLPAPLEVLRSWLSHATPGGILVAQEYEQITAGDEVVARYLAASEAMVASTNATLKLGPLLERDLEGAVKGIGTVLHNEPVTFPVTAALMSEIFLLNVPSLSERGALTPDELERLASDLRRFGEGGAHVEASVREIVVRRG